MNNYAEIMRLVGEVNGLCNKLEADTAAKLEAKRQEKRKRWSMFMDEMREYINVAKMVGNCEKFSIFIGEGKYILIAPRLWVVQPGRVEEWAYLHELSDCYCGSDAQDKVLDYWYNSADHMQIEAEFTAWVSNKLADKAERAQKKNDEASK